MLGPGLLAPTEFSHTLDTEEGALHYVDVGAGEPVLLIHAFGPQPGVTSWLIYREVIELLSGKYRCIGLDMPNFGLSGPVRYNEPYHDVVVRAAIRLLVHLNIDRLPVVGTSMGATSALDLAIQAPERVERLVIGSCHASTGGDPYVLMPFPSEVARAHAEAQANPEDRAVLARLLRTLVYDEALVSEELVSSVHAFRADRMEHLAAETGSRSVAHSNLAALREVELPVKIIHGRFDRMVPLEQALLIMSYLPQADVTVLNRCGHWPPVERPSAFASLVDQFVAAGLGRRW